MNTSYFNRRPGVSTVIVLIAALVGGLIGYLVSNSQPTVYTSTARYVVSPGPALLGGDPRDLVLGLDALNTPTIVATYAEVMMSPRVIDQAAVDIGLDASDLADYEVSAVEVPSASLIDVSVIGPDAGTAASLANATGERSATLAGALFSAYELQALDPATAPSEPSSPLPTRDALLAAVFAGGLAGFLLLQTLITGRVRPANTASHVGLGTAIAGLFRRPDSIEVDFDWNWKDNPEYAEAGGAERGVVPDEYLAEQEDERFTDGDDPRAESDLETEAFEDDEFDLSSDLGDEYEYEDEHDDEPVTDPGSR